MKPAAKQPAQWRTVADVPAGAICVIAGGRAIRVVAHIGDGALYRDLESRHDGPFSINANTLLAGVS